MREIKKTPLTPEALREFVRAEAEDADCGYVACLRDGKSAQKREHSGRLWELRRLVETFDIAIGRPI